MDIFSGIKKVHEDNFSVFLSGKISNFLKKYRFENWNLNRPVDTSRVSSLKKYYYEHNQTTVPGQIACNLVGNVMIVYDGMHRITAALESRLDMHVFLIVKKQWSDENIKEDFKKLNYGVNVPYVYMDGSSELKKKICQDVAQKLCEQFSDNVSPSRMCHKQNFNRDSLVDFVSQLEIDFEIPHLAVKIYEILLGLNSVGKKFIEDNSINVVKKTVKTGLYMFYLSSDYRKSRIEEYLNIGI